MDKKEERELDRLRTQVLLDGEQERLHDIIVAGPETFITYLSLTKEKMDMVADVIDVGDLSRWEVGNFLSCAIALLVREHWQDIVKATASRIQTKRKEDI